MRLLLIDVGSHFEARVEEGKVETDVEVLNGLPLQIGIADRRNGGTQNALAIEHIVGSTEQGHRGTVADLLVTYTTPTETELTIGEPVLTFEEGLTTECPGCTCRWEGSILAAVGEAARTVGTDGCGEIVAAVVVVHHTTEPRNEGVVAGIAARLLVLLTCTYLTQRLGIVGRVLTRTGHIDVAVALHGETSHEGHVMLLGIGVDVGGGVGPVVVEVLTHGAAHIAELIELVCRVDGELRSEVIAALEACIGTVLSAEGELLDGLDLEIWDDNHAIVAGMAVGASNSCHGVPRLVVVRTLVVAIDVVAPEAFVLEDGGCRVH